MASNHEDVLAGAGDDTDDTIGANNIPTDDDGNESICSHQDSKTGSAYDSDEDTANSGKRIKLENVPRPESINEDQPVSAVLDHEDEDGGVYDADELDFVLDDEDGGGYDADELYLVLDDEDGEVYDADESYLVLDHEDGGGYDADESDSEPEARN